MAGSGGPVLGKGRGMRHLSQLPGSTLSGERRWSAYVEASELQRRGVGLRLSLGRGAGLTLEGQGVGPEEGVLPAGAQLGAQPEECLTAGNSEPHRLVLR